MKIKQNRKKETNAYKALSRERNIRGWLFMLPLVLILYVFVWRSTAFGVGMSFFRMQGYSIKEFCGLKNYITVIKHTQFLPMLSNTVQYVFWSLIIGFLPPLFIAVLLNEVIHGRGFFRALIYVPAIIPGISAMLIWYYLYLPDQSGLLNMLLSVFGIEPQKWLNDPAFAKIGIVIYMTWKGFGGAMLLYFSALQSVSTELYEAAILDGAGSFKRFWHVTRPGIEGVLLLNLVSQIIGVFQIIDQPLAMTGGGPNGATMSLGLQLYQYGFNSAGKGTGQAMALGVIIFLILMVMTVFYFKLNKKVEERY